ncbi:hypothetical protein [Nocardioides houyundeii]|uniref:hypothetical protein n=1 Tax=Nocardioides houyundeii TaxID=2045452 RepID=UPI000C759FA7|nr:hypothetical protein [Nocardioides houyundeii]
MSAATATVAGLLSAALALSALGWRVRRRRLVAALTLVLLATAALLAALWTGEAPSARWSVALVVLTGALAVAGGGPVTTAVFSLVDGRGPDETGSVRRAAEVLRGGAWIGALERAAIFVSIAAGWPEGIAITLALKGLGRYPELRHQERPGIAERFLIGTFVSVLWAASCAGVLLLT